MPFPNAPSPLSYGAPQVDFSQLGELGNQYFKSAEDRRKYDLARAFQGGVPRKPDGTPDIQAMTETLAQHGSVDIPQMQEQVDRRAAQDIPGPYSGSQAPAGAPNASPALQGGSPVTSFRDAVPSPAQPALSATGSDGGGAQNLRALGTELAGGRDVSDIIDRFAQVNKIRPDDALTPDQEQRIKPLLAKSIAARAAMGQGAGQPAPAQPPAALSPAAQPQSNPTIALPPGFNDPKQAIDALRKAADNLERSGSSYAKDRAKAYREDARNIEAQAFGTQPGFERVAGGMRPIAGGPEDPAYLAAKGAAGMTPVKIGMGAFGEELYAVRDPASGGFRVIDPKTGQLGQVVPAGAAGAPAPARESTIPARDLELDKKAGRNVEYLQNLDPDQQGIVRKMANYEMNPSSLSIKGGHRERVLAAVAQFDPSYDQKNYLAFSDGLKKFQSGKEGAGVRSFNVGIEHIDQLLELGRALDNGNIPKINELKNWWKTNTGDEGPTNFNGLKAIVGAEIVKAIVGAGGTGEERAAAAKTVSGASSIKQLEGIAKTYASAMGAQLGGLQRQYEQSTGRKDFDRLLSPQAIRYRDSHNAPSSGGAGAVPASAAPPPMTERKSGQVYQTPKGPMTWTGTGWLPAQQQ